MFNNFYMISHGKGQFAHYFDGKTSSDNTESVFLNIAASSALTLNTLEEAEHVLSRCQEIKPDIYFSINIYNT